MHLSMLYTFVVCASLVHSQAINASESSPDPSGTISTSPKAFNGGKFVPTTSFRSCSNNSSQPPITKQHENSSRSSANIQEVGTTPTASYSIFPRSPPGGVSMNSSDAKSSQKMMAGTSSATVPTSGSIQSAMAAMSTNSAVASGSRTSRTANGTNSTTTSAPTAGLAKKNIAGQIHGFADTAVVLLLIGMFAGL